MAIGPTLASPDKEYWAVLSQWKTAGMVVETACTDHKVTNIDAFLDFCPFNQSSEIPMEKLREWCAEGV